MEILFALVVVGAGYLVVTKIKEIRAKDRTKEDVGHRRPPDDEYFPDPDDR